MSALQLRYPAGCHCRSRDAALDLLAWGNNKGDRGWLKELSAHPFTGPGASLWGCDYCQQLHFVIKNLSIVRTGKRGIPKISLLKAYKSK